VRRAERPALSIVILGLAFGEPDDGLLRVLLSETQSG